MADLTLRATVGRALTNDEIDTNFTNLNSDVQTRLLAASYTAADVLSKLETVDGSGSGLDADLLQGHYPATTATSNTIVLRDASGNFAANTITAALTGNASTATKLATSRTIALVGDATASGSFDGSANYSQTLTLATVNTNTGTFGSGTAIPVVTVNGKGLVTAMSTAAINTTLSLAANTGTGSVSLGGTLRIAQGTGITTSVNSGTFTIAVDGTIATQTYVTTTVNNTVQTAGQNSQGAKTVQPTSAGVPSNSTGNNGDIIYQY